MVNTEIENTNMASPAVEPNPINSKTHTEDTQKPEKPAQQNGSLHEDDTQKPEKTAQQNGSLNEDHCNHQTESKDTPKIETELKPEVKTEVKPEEKPEAKASNPTQSLSDESYKKLQGILDSVNSRAVYLVHWENPVHSGAALGSILAFLVLTAYSSLVNILCGLALLVIGADWIWVVGAKQFKTIFNYQVVNPHDKYLKEPPQISKENLYPYVDVWVDITNVLLVEATKIVLIEDPLRSMKYVGILYCTWTVLSWFSFRTLISMAVITAFAVPKLYKKNQALVDKHLEKAQVVAKDYIDRGVDAVGKNTGNLIPMVQKFAASKGWIANPDATKKQA